GRRLAHHHGRRRDGIPVLPTERRSGAGPPIPPDRAVGGDGEAAHGFPAAGDGRVFRAAVLPAVAALRRRALPRVGRVLVVAVRGCGGRVDLFDRPDDTVRQAPAAAAGRGGGGAAARGAFIRGGARPHLPPAPPGRLQRP